MRAKVEKPTEPGNMPGTAAAIALRSQKTPRATSTAQPRSRLSDARARMYRSLIFESAEHIFGREGFDGATMHEIASEAGVSLKTVYASFPSKQDIYSQIMVERSREMAEDVAKARSGGSNAMDRLDLGTRAFVTYLFSHQDWLQMHLRSRLSWALRPKNEVSGQLWQEGLDAHADLIQEGIDSGDFYDEDPVELSILVQAMTKVQVSQAVTAGDLDADRVSDRLMKRLVRLLGRKSAEADGGNQ